MAPSEKMEDIVLRLLWSDKDEQQLRKECPKFQLRRNPYDMERMCWKLCYHVFGRNLPDLFTYGLKPRPNIQKLDLDHCQAGTGGSRSDEFYCRLARLMTHPIFERKLHYLRFVLQMAVYHRVEGHIEPYGPMPIITPHFEAVEKIVTKAQGKGKAKEHDSRWADSVMAHALVKHTRPTFNPAISDLLLGLELAAQKKREKSVQLPNWTPEDFLVFELDEPDIQAVIDALNDQADMFNHTSCEHFYTAFADQMGHRLPMVEPATWDDLEDLVHDVALLKERRYRLRVRLKAALGGPEGRQLHVFDTPPADLDPIYIFDNDFSSQARLVLVGEVSPERFPLLKSIESRQLYVSQQGAGLPGMPGPSDRETVQIEYRHMVAGRRSGSFDGVRDDEIWIEPEYELDSIFATQDLVVDGSVALNSDADGSGPEYQLRSLANSGKYDSDVEILDSQEPRSVGADGDILERIAQYVDGDFLWELLQRHNAIAVGGFMEMEED